LKLKTFSAPTYTEALNKVKEELGDDVVIVSSKEIKKKTLTSQGLYEIVVAVEEDNIKPRKKATSNEEHVKEVMLKLSSAAKEISSLSEEEPSFNYNTNVSKKSLGANPLEPQKK